MQYVPDPLNVTEILDAQPEFPDVVSSYRTLGRV